MKCSRGPDIIRDIPVFYGHLPKRMKIIKFKNEDHVKYSLWVGKGQNKHNVVCKANTSCSNSATCIIYFLKVYKFPSHW